MARSTNVNVGIRLSADGRQLVGQARLSREEMRKLGMEFDQSGRRARGFSRDSERAGRSTEALGQGVSRLRGLLGALGVSLSVVGLQRLITGTTQALDEIGKLSRSTGIATDDLQRLEFAASQTGVQFNTLTSGLQYFQRQLTENDQVREFAEALDIRHLETTDQLLAIAEQFEGITDPAERAAAAARLFGRSAGPEMLKLIEEGAEGIRQLTGRADELGLVLDDKAIAAAEQFNDSWDEVRRSLSATLRAGVMQGLTNESDEMSDAWYTLTEVLTSPELRDGIATIVSGIVTITTAAARGVAGLGALRNALQDVFGATPDEEWERQLQRLERLRESADRYREALNRAQEAGYDGPGGISDSQRRLDQIEEEITQTETLIARHMDYSDAGDETAKTLARIVVEGTTAGDMWRNLLREQRAATQATQQAAREQRQFEAAFGRLHDQLNPVQAATRQYREQVDLLDRAWAEGLISGEDYWDLLNRLATGAEDAVEETRELAREADPFAEAWKRAIEDVDRAFVQLWESAFGGFRSFADQLKRSFQRLLAELAHAAVTRPILVQMGVGTGLMGGASTASAASATMDNLSSFGSLMQMGSSAFSTMGSHLGGLAIHAQHGTGLFSQQSAMLAAQEAGMGTLAGNLATFGSYAGGALVGVLAGSMISGGYSALGSSGNTAVLAGTGIGAAVGGPLGAAIGGALGGVVNRVFGRGPEKVRSDRLELGVDDFDVFGERVTRTRQSGGLLRSSKRRTYREELDDDVAGFINDRLGEFRDEFDLLLDRAGSDALRSFRMEAQGIDIRGLSDAEIEQAIGEWMDSVAEAMLSAAVRQLDPAFRRLVASQGSTEDQLAMFGLLGDLHQMMTQSPVAAGIEAWENAQRSTTEVYRAQVLEVERLASGYDRTVDSTRELAEAFAASREMAAQLTVALLAAANEVDAVLGRLSLRIQEDLIRDDDALYDFRRGRVDMLTEALSGMTDPTQILETIREIEQLTGQMWGSLDPSQQDEMGGGFLSFLDEINELAQDQIADAIAALEDSARATTGIVDDALSGGDLGRAADRFRSLIDRLLPFGDLFGRSVANFETTTRQMEDASVAIARAVDRFERSTTITVNVETGETEVGG